MHVSATNTASPLIDAKPPLRGGPQPPSLVPDPNAPTDGQPGALVVDAARVEQASLDPSADEFRHTVEGFHAALETQNPDYDLNADGVVNIDDLYTLLELIHQHEQSEQAAGDTPPAAAAPTIVTNPLDAFSVPTQADPTNALSAGVTESPRESLAALADKLTQRLIDGGYAFQPPRNLEALVDQFDLGKRERQFVIERVNSQYGDPDPRTAIQQGTQIAGQVIDRLAQAGFIERPPVNIRELIDSLPVSAATQGDVLSRISARFPQGLGLNLIG